ncbi:hypothetical protein MRBLMN1_000431 [Chitinophaga ginsengisegetis]|uniref:hypothetical protein n=1 Tax=Chitinophaga ginsengisegetis TaxID=393003 RepID=UPI0034421F2D
MNELIETRFYNFYLGEEEVGLSAKYTDTAARRKEILKLRNKLFGDSYRFGILYLDTALRPYFSPLSVYKAAANPYSRLFLQVICSFSDQPQSIIDSLNHLQQTYIAADFESCVAMIRNINDIDTTRFSIGRIKLSAICFNRQHNRGILYYEFRCGWLCGKGEVLVIEKTTNCWRIANTMQEWRS